MGVLHETIRAKEKKQGWKSQRKERKTHACYISISQIIDNISVVFHIALLTLIYKHHSSITHVSDSENRAVLLLGATKTHTEIHVKGNFSTDLHFHN